MSEAQKLLIKRCGLACVQHLILADLAQKLGQPRIAAEHRLNAELSSEVAFLLAAVPA